MHCPDYPNPQFDNGQTYEESVFGIPRHSLVNPRRLTGRQWRIGLSKTARAGGQGEQPQPKRPHHWMSSQVGADKNTNLLAFLSTLKMEKSRSRRECCNFTRCRDLDDLIALQENDAALALHSARLHQQLTLTIVLEGCSPE
jgi:hypothetical protein